MPLALIRCLPRLMRWAIVASGTRKARAISAVEHVVTGEVFLALGERTVGDGRNAVTDAHGPGVR
jgi:hypothetical protein